MPLKFNLQHVICKWVKGVIRAGWVSDWRRGASKTNEEESNLRHNKHADESKHKPILDAITKSVEINDMAISDKVERVEQKLHGCWNWETRTECGWQRVAASLYIPARSCLDIELLDLKTRWYGIMISANQYKVIRNGRLILKVRVCRSGSCVQLFTFGAWKWQHDAQQNLLVFG